MKFLLLLTLLAAPFAAAHEDGEDHLTPGQVRYLLRQGRRLYEQGEAEAFAEAARTFALAAQHADPAEVHLDAVRLAEAKAWLQADRPDLALNAFEQIQGFDAPADRARHRLLRGNAHLAAGELALAGEDFEAAKEQMEQAIQSLIDALQTDPASEEAKRSLEIAHRRLRYVIDNQPPPPPPEGGEGDAEQDDEDENQEQEPQPQPQPQPEEGEGDAEEEPGEDDRPQMPPPAPEDQPQDGEPEEGEGDGDPADAREAPLLEEEVAEHDGPDLDLDTDNLDEEEARRALEALMEQERRLREQILQNRRIRTIPVEKDW